MLKQILVIKSLLIRSSRSSIFPSIAAIPIKKQRSSSAILANDMTQEEYLKFKENFIEKFNDKQHRLAIATEKLIEIRENQRIKQEDETDVPSDAGAKGHSLIDDNSSSSDHLRNNYEICHPNAAESDIKINCIRATNTFGDENSTMVAADKIAEGTIKIMEDKRMSNDHSTDPGFSETMVNICLNVAATTPTK